MIRTYNIGDIIDFKGNILPENAETEITWYLDNSSIGYCGIIANNKDISSKNEYYKNILKEDEDYYIKNYGHNIKVKMFRSTNGNTIKLYAKIKK